VSPLSEREEMSSTKLFDTDPSATLGFNRDLNGRRGFAERENAVVVNT